jgi:ATP-binding cassette, subfamily B, bacterial
LSSTINTPPAAAPATARTRGWWYIVTLIRRFPVAYAISSAGILSFYLTPLLQAALTQRLFDVLGSDLARTADGRTATIAALITVCAMPFFRVVLSLGWAGEVMLNALCSALMRHNLLRRILMRPGAAPLPQGSSPGEAISRLRDDLAHISELVAWTIDPVGQAIAVALALLVLLRVDAWLTALAFAPLLVIIVAAQLINRRVQAARLASQKAVGAVTGLLGELFGAVQSVKVAGAEDRVIAHLDKVNATRRKTGLRDHLISNIAEAFSFGAGHIATGFVLLAGADALRAGRLTVGDLVLFASYLTWLSTVGGMLGGFMTRYQATLVSLDRATELLQGAPGPELVAPERDIVLTKRALASVQTTPARRADDALRDFEARGASFRFPNGAMGIDAIDLRITRGQIVIVTGRIGSGKTTLLRALLGLLPLEHGELRWNGQRIDAADVFLTPPRAAYTPQTPRLFSETLRDNLTLGEADNAAALEHALYRAVLEDDVPTLEHGLDTRVGPRGVKLSGGQLQRSAAARMFTRQADLLVVDDLSSALDVRTEAELWSRLRADADTTCIAVSNRREALRQADLVLLMHAGKIIARGALDELLATHAEMRALWDGGDQPGDEAAGG